jgi:hypothetical protein
MLNIMYRFMHLHSSLCLGLGIAEHCHLPRFMGILSSLFAVKLGRRRVFAITTHLLIPQPMHYIVALISQFLFIESSTRRYPFQLAVQT